MQAHETSVVNESLLDRWILPRWGDKLEREVGETEESAKLLILLVDLVGIEPTTSSMPWKRAPKLRHRPTRSKDATFLLSPLGRNSSNPACSRP